MSNHEPEYRAYMLRLWQVQEATGYLWHASLQSVETGELTGFACLEELMAFLRQSLGRPQEADRSQTGGETGMSLHEDGRPN